MIDLELPQGKRTLKYRLFEILPGALSFTTLAAPIVLSIISPLLGAAFVILYIITWLVKAVGMAFRTIQGYNKLQDTKKIDWYKRLHDLSKPKAALRALDMSEPASKLHQMFLQEQINTVDRLKPNDIYNVVIIATYNETREILQPTIESVLACEYDMDHLIVVLAYEERGGPATDKLAKSLQKEYRAKFADFIIAKHPKDLPNEVVGKGGNITFAGRKVARYIENRKIDADNVIITTLDSDNRPASNYFAYLTYEYIIHPDPRHVAFQPLALFLNNIWDVPAPMRVVATGNSFWNVVNSLRPHMLRNFAAHSQSLAALIDMDFWSTRTIVEDGHQFWRSYFRYDGYYDVVPLYTAVYQDAVLSDTYWKTLKAQFVQVRRWAYGASDVAYVAVRVFSKDRTVPLFDGVGKFMRLLEGHVSWAVASIILLLGAFAPLYFGDQASQSIVAHELPTVISRMQQLAMIGLFITVFLSFKILPSRPERYKRRRNFFMLIQWVLMPFTAVAYGSLAAIYSQTRLVFGRYMDKFDVTDKVVKSDDEKH